MKNKFLYCVLFVALTVSAGSCKSAKDDTANVEYITEPIAVEKKGQEKIDPNQRLRVKGEWTILSAAGKNVEASEDNRAYIDFSAKEGKIYGYSGCNYINGEFNISGINDISFSNVLSTLRMCDNIRDEDNIKKGLNEASSFVVYRKDGLYYLDIRNKQGSVVLHMKRHNADVPSGAWTVRSIHSKPVTGITLIIDIPELKIHGTTGCNILNGSIGLDRNKDWFIQFQNIATTRKMCSEERMDIERNLLVALEEVELIQRINHNEIKLADKNGKEVLFLDRTEVEKDNTQVQ